MIPHFLSERNFSVYKLERHQLAKARHLDETKSILACAAPEKTMEETIL